MWNCIFTISPVYFFGQGLHRTVPGTTHHGQPMERLHMGRTELPIEVIQEYLESLAQIYTPEVGIRLVFYINDRES